MLSSQAQTAERSVTTYEEKVAKLQALVDAKDAELNKFKHDTDTQRQERIKVLIDVLTVGVPQTTADINKFISDAKYYPPEIRKHFDSQILVLANLCGDYLSTI